MTCCISVCACVYLLFLYVCPFHTTMTICQIIIVMNLWCHWAKFVWSCNYHIIIINVMLCLKANMLYCLYIHAPAVYRPKDEINCSTTLWKAQCRPWFCIQELLHYFPVWCEYVFSVSSPSKMCHRWLWYLVGAFMLHSSRY